MRYNDPQLESPGENGPGTVDVCLARTMSTRCSWFCGTCVAVQGRKEGRSTTAAIEQRRKKEEKKKKKKKRGERVSEAGLASSSFLSAAALKDRGIKADLWTFI